MDASVHIGNQKIRYKIVGSGNHTVFCLPGVFGCFETDFEPICSKIDIEKFTLICWDPPGYGKSRPPDRDFSGEYCKRDAQVAKKFMEKLGIEKYSILGWSNGGITGIHLASECPSAVTKLVTWGAHAYVEEKDVTFCQMMNDLSLWSDAMKLPLLEIYEEAYLVKMLGQWAEAAEANFKFQNEARTIETLSRVSCPTLVIHGDQDPVVGVGNAEFIHKHLRNSRLHIMKGGKHNLHLRFTEEFLHLVQNFLLENFISKY